MTSRWDDYVAAERELRAAESRARAADYVPHLLDDMSGTRARLGAALAFLDRQRPAELVAAVPDRVGRWAIEGGLEGRYAAGLLDAADPELRDAVVARLVDAVTAADRTSDNSLEVAGLLAVLSRPQDTALRERVLAYGRGHADPDVVDLVDDPPGPWPRPPVEPVPRPAATTSGDGAAEWGRYVMAWQRYIASFHAVRADPPIDEIVADLRRETPAALEFVSSLRVMPDDGLLGRVTGAARAEPQT